MKKIMMAVVGVALAVAFTGCSKSSEDDAEKKEKEAASIGSPKSVAVDFAKAFIKRDVGAAVELWADSVLGGTDDREQYKESLKSRITQEMEKCSINKEALVSVGSETITVDMTGYTVKDGVKILNDSATVAILFKKDDNPLGGMTVALGRYNDKWMVKEWSFGSGAGRSWGDTKRAYPVKAADKAAEKAAW